MGTGLRDLIVEEANKGPGFIYMATFPNGESYVGQHNGKANLKSYKLSHKRKAERGSAYLFHNAIRKYGWDSIKWKKLIKNVDIEDLDCLEIHYIMKYNTLMPNGYNMTIGGNAPMQGRKETEQHRRNIGNALRGKKYRPMSQEGRDNLRKSQKKKWTDPKYKIRQGEALGRAREGKKLPDYWREGIKKAWTPERKEAKRLAMKRLWDISKEIQARLED